MAVTLICRRDNNQVPIAILERLTDKPGGYFIGYKIVASIHPEVIGKEYKEKNLPLVIKYLRSLTQSKAGEKTSITAGHPTKFTPKLMTGWPFPIYGTAVQYCDIFMDSFAPNIVYQQGWFGVETPSYLLYSGQDEEEFLKLFRKITPAEKAQAAENLQRVLDEIDDLERSTPPTIMETPFYPVLGWLSGK